MQALIDISAVYNDFFCCYAKQSFIIGVGKCALFKSGRIKLIGIMSVRTKTKLVLFQYEKNKNMDNSIFFIFD